MDMNLATNIIPLPLPPTDPVKFKPPTLPEMQFYGKAIKIPPDEIEHCYDHYTSNGWKVGRSPMKDWQAAMRNWKRNLSKYSPFSQPPRPTSGNF